MNNTKDKQLFLVSAYRVDDDGVVAEATEPSWVVETTEDRAKAKLQAKYIEDSPEDDWRVAVVQTFRFQ